MRRPGHTASQQESFPLDARVLPTHRQDATVLSSLPDARSQELSPTGCGIRTSAQGHCSGPRGQAPPLCAELCWLVRAGPPKGSWLCESSESREVEGAMRRSRGAKTRGTDSSRVRRGWQHLRPQPRVRMGDARGGGQEDAEDGLFQNSQRRLGCRSGADSPPSRVLPGPAGSGLSSRYQTGGHRVFKILLVFWSRTAVGAG